MGNLPALFRFDTIQALKILHHQFNNNNNNKNVVNMSFGYSPSLSTGIYGIYRINRTSYLPSLSTGILMDVHATTKHK